MSKLNKPDDLGEPLITKDDKLSWLRKIFSPEKPASSSVSGEDTLWNQLIDPEKAKTMGDNLFYKGLFTGALKFYDRAIELDPENATYHSNRRAALSRSRNIWEAVKECEEAIIWIQNL